MLTCANLNAAVVGHVLDDLPLFLDANPGSIFCAVNCDLVLQVLLIKEGFSVRRRLLRSLYDIDNHSVDQVQIEGLRSSL